MHQRGKTIDNQGPSMIRTESFEYHTGRRSSENKQLYVIDYPVPSYVMRYATPVNVSVRLKEMENNYSSTETKKGKRNEKKWIFQFL